MRMLLTNDGASLLAVDEPAGVEHLQKQVDMLVGTRVDTLCWNLGISGASRYDTRASTRWGQGLDKMDSRATAGAGPRPRPASA